MTQQYKKSELFFPHKKKYLLEISQSISYCSNCSSAIITDKFGTTKSTIKPLQFHSNWAKKYEKVICLTSNPEILCQKFIEFNKNFAFPNLNYQIQQNISFSFFQDTLTNDIHKFSNYKEFSKIRLEFIKKIKNICEKLKLNLKTYFLSIEYFYQICSILISFSKEYLIQIANICIILAAKTNETKTKAIKVKLYLTPNISANSYLKDELYILSKLNYDLIRITSYDILTDIMKCGFVFNDEEFNHNILNSVYNQMENMLYLFSETKYYINHNRTCFSFMAYGRLSGRHSYLNVY